MNYLDRTLYEDVFKETPDFDTTVYEIRAVHWMAKRTRLIRLLDMMTKRYGFDGTPRKERYYSNVGKRTARHRVGGDELGITAHTVMLHMERVMRILRHPAAVRYCKDTRANVIPMNCILNEVPEPIMAQ